MLLYFIIICSIFIELVFFLVCFFFVFRFRLSLGILIIISPFLFPAIETNCEIVISQEIVSSGTRKLNRVKINVSIENKQQNITVN